MIDSTEMITVTPARFAELAQLTEVQFCLLMEFELPNPSTNPNALPFRWRYTTRESSVTWNDNGTAKVFTPIALKLEGSAAASEGKFQEKDFKFSMEFAEPLRTVVGARMALPVKVRIYECLLDPLTDEAAVVQVSDGVLSECTSDESKISGAATPTSLYSRNKIPAIEVSIYDQRAAYHEEFGVTVDNAD